MKNKSYYLLMLMLCATMFAKAGDSTSASTSKHVKPYSRMYIGPSFTLNANYRILQQNGGTSADPVHAQIKDRNKYEIPEIGAIAGLKVGVNLTRWLAVESGIQYSWVRYRYRGQDYVTDGIGSYRSYYRNTYHYLDVPLALNFIAGKKRVRGVFSLGTNFDFLVRYEHKFSNTYLDGHSVDGTETTTNDHLKKFDLSPFLGIGVDCYITRGIDLRIMPVGQIQALKNPSAHVSEYLWSAGLNVSLLFGVFRTNQR